MKEGRVCERHRIHRRYRFRLQSCKRLQGSIYRMAFKRLATPVYWASE